MSQSRLIDVKRPGFKVGDKTEQQVRFDTSLSGSSSFTYSIEFKVMNAGEHPLVHVTHTEDRKQWGGNYTKSSVTLDDEKQFDSGGWN